MGNSLKELKFIPYLQYQRVLPFLDNKFVDDELNYDKVQLGRPRPSLLEKLIDEQHIVYSTIMKHVLAQDGQFYFCMATVEYARYFLFYFLTKCKIFL